MVTVILTVKAEDTDDDEIGFIGKNIREAIFVRGFDGFAMELSRYNDACRDSATAALNTGFNTDKPITDDHYMDISYAIDQFYLNELRPYAYNYYKAIDKGEPRHALTNTASAEIFNKCNALKDSVNRSVKAYKDQLTSIKP